MDRYLDLRLLPDPEFRPTTLMSALFSKLHRVLAEQSRTNIGVSFPLFEKRTLGTLLRLHGEQSHLDSLMNCPWLTGMRDHVHVEPIGRIPASVQHRQVRRIQAKSSPERIRRRQIKRHGLTSEEARQKIPETVAQQVNLPYVTLSSSSTGQRFPLFIEHGPVQDKPIPGEFNTYGLSKGATVPWF